MPLTSVGVMCYPPSRSLTPLSLTQDVRDTGSRLARLGEGNLPDIGLKRRGREKNGKKTKRPARVV